MQITVPNDICANPLEIIINGVSYKLGAGETVDVPDEVVNELYHMLALKAKEAQPVDVPFEDRAMKKALQALDARVTAVESILPELPALPAEDGSYSLQLTMNDDEPTLTWETISG